MLNPSDTSSNLMLPGNSSIVKLTFNLACTKERLVDRKCIYLERNRIFPSGPPLGFRTDTKVVGKFANQQHKIVYLFLRFTSQISLVV